MSPGEGTLALVSCHAERFIDDRIWTALLALVEARPGDFEIAALVRPPEPDESEDRWLERVRALGARVTLGHHPHFVGPRHARPRIGDPTVERVTREATWLQSHGFAMRYFCPGGWYVDPELLAAVAGLGYVDLAATSFALDPRYLPPASVRLGLERPAWIELRDGRKLLEIPTTHSLGGLPRALARLPGRLSPFVHVHFHDWELLDRSRRLALVGLLRVLGARATPVALDELAARVRSTAPSISLERALVDAARPLNAAPDAAPGRG